MKKMSISEMITYSTVLINCKYQDGTAGTGTGFVMNLLYDDHTHQCFPVIITNKHVVKDSVECMFEFCGADANGEPIDKETFVFKYTLQNWVMHPNDKVDLCCLPLGKVLNELNNQSIKVFYIPLETSIIPSSSQLEELFALEDIIMIGYPIGLSDEFNHKTIIRRGSTATHIKNDYQGKKEFLIDMACFPGSSGSPVLILNQGSYPTQQGVTIGDRVYFVGVLYAGPQYTTSGVISFANLPNARSSAKFSVKSSSGKKY